MKPPVGVCVFEKPIVILIEKSRFFIIICTRNGKIITINKVIAGVVRRVNINHLDLTEVAFLQKFQNFQVVTLNVEVFGGVPIHAFFLARTQGLADRLVGFHDSSLFANPCKFVGFVTLQYIAGKHLAEQVKVDGFFHLAIFAHGFGDAVGEHSTDFINVLSRHIGRLHSHFIHVYFPPFIFLNKFSNSRILSALIIIPRFIGIRVTGTGTFGKFAKCNTPCAVNS